MTDCVFCNIVAGNIPAHRVHEDDAIVAIMDVGHVNPGHTLVIAKRHAATMMDLDEETAGKAFLIANRIAKALERAFQPEGMTILQANRPAGFQTVGHFHMHVLPRYTGDGCTLTWPAKNPSQEDLAGYAAQVRAELA